MYMHTHTHIGLYRDCTWITVETKY